MTAKSIDSSLIRRAYFVSPLYETKFNRASTKEQGHTEVRWERLPDAGDNFPAWLNQNSYPRIVQSRAGPHNGGSLTGENGVHCQLIHTSIFPDGPNKDLSFLGEIGKYHRVVQVSSMPSARTIPEELLKAFKERRYEIRQEDDLLVKSLKALLL